MKGFNVSLWRNDRKTKETHPDATGSISIPISVIRDLSIAYQQRELPTEQDNYHKIEVVKLEASAWRNDPSKGGPVMRCEIRNWEEMKTRRAERDAYKAEQAQNGNAQGWGQDPAWGQQPQGGQPHGGQAPPQQQQPPQQTQWSQGHPGNPEHATSEIPF